MQLFNSGDLVDGAALTGLVPFPGVRACRDAGNAREVCEHSGTKE